jgi:hypothetical protein
MAAILEDMTKMRNVAFECPICMTLALSGPIKQCKNGHHICDTCASKVEKCPSCKEKIDVRNLQLENLREVTPLPCQFMEQGCKEELKLKDLKNHQDQCHHGLLQCVIADCKAKIQLKDLISHLDLKHEKLTEINCLTWTLGTVLLGCHVTFETVLLGYHVNFDMFNQATVWKPNQLKCNDEHFYVQMSRNDVGIWLVWVQYAGYAPKAQEYWCTIKTNSESDSKLYVEFRGDVIPMTVDRKMANGLLMLDTMVRKLKTNDLGLFFNVTIGKR